MRKKGVQIKTIEDALFCIQAGEMLYFGSHCHNAGQLKNWTLRKFMSAVNKGMLWLPEPKLKGV